jgi:Kinesin motor domain
MASRTVGSTAMNDTSSRSHSVLTIKLHQRDASDESKSTFAKINLVRAHTATATNLTAACCCCYAFGVASQCNE